MRCLVFLPVLALAATPAAARQQLDAHFVADRVLVDAPLTDGGHIRFWTDTGGGGTFLTNETVARLKLTTEPVTGPAAEEMGPRARQLAAPLAFKPGAFPTPPSPIIVGPDQLASFGIKPDSDGLIGQTWFAGHIWTWDYPHGTLTLEDADWKPAADAHVVPVTFRPAKGEQIALHFPRIIVSIVGEEVPMLLDTGATTVLTPEVAQELGVDRLGATSMIVASRIAAWRKAHPDWRVIEKAQSGTGARMIEVPDVTIAGFEVGPIWFTERPDPNFRGMMSAAMDAPVEGAIGGNAFHSLQMTIDYVHGRAAFVRR